MTEINPIILETHHKLNIILHTIRIIEVNQTMVIDLMIVTIHAHVIPLNQIIGIEINLETNIEVLLEINIETLDRETDLT